MLLRNQTILFIAFVSTVFADRSDGGTLEEEVKLKSTAIVQYVEKNGLGKEFQIRSLSPSAFLGSSRVLESLKSHLLQHSYAESVDAKFTIVVALSIFEDTNFGDSSAIQVSFSLQDINGRALTNFDGEFDIELDNEKRQVTVEQGVTTAKLDHFDDVAVILGKSISLRDVSSQDLKKDNVQKIDRIIDKDTGHSNFQNSTRLSSNKDRLFEIEILVAAKGTKEGAAPPENSYLPVPIKINSKGIAEIELKRDDLVAIRFYNNSDYSVLAEACLDGINSFAFSSSKGLFAYEVSPHKSNLIRGFHQHAKGDHHEFKHFKIVDFSESLFYRTNSSDTQGLGSIAVHVRSADPKFVERSGENAFGEGPAFTETAKEKKVPKTPIIESIVVRYLKPKA